MMTDDDDFKELFFRLISVYELAPDVADILFQRIIRCFCEVDEVEEERSNNKL